MLLDVRDQRGTPRQAAAVDDAGDRGGGGLQTRPGEATRAESSVPATWAPTWWNTAGTVRAPGLTRAAVVLKELGGAWGMGSVQTWVLPSDRTAAFHARRLLEVACAGMSVDRLDVGCLLATELVSNAVLHGGGTILLSVARDGEDLRVEVFDDSPVLPVVMDGQPLREHGAGLRLVVALASSWGTTGREDSRPGKCVWFALN